MKMSRCAGWHGMRSCGTGKLGSACNCIPVSGAIGALACVLCGTWAIDRTCLVFALIGVSLSTVHRFALVRLRTTVTILHAVLASSVGRVHCRQDTRRLFALCSTAKCSASCNSAACKMLNTSLPVAEGAGAAATPERAGTSSPGRHDAG